MKNNYSPLTLQIIWKMKKKKKLTRRFFFLTKTKPTHTKHTHTTQNTTKGPTFFFPFFEVQISNTLMYIKSWDEFSSASEELFQRNPEKTRYVMKYRHCDGTLVLKVTDDFVCLKYRTDQQQDVKKMEKLTNTFLRRMTNK